VLIHIWVDHVQCESYWYWGLGSDRSNHGHVTLNSVIMLFIGKPKGRSIITSFVKMPLQKLSYCASIHGLRGYISTWEWQCDLVLYVKWARVRSCFRYPACGLFRACASGCVPKVVNHGSWCGWVVLMRASSGPILGCRGWWCERFLEWYWIALGFLPLWE